MSKKALKQNVDWERHPGDFAHWKNPENHIADLFMVSLSLNVNKYHT